MLSVSERPPPPPLFQPQQARRRRLNNNAANANNPAGCAPCVAWVYISAGIAHHKVGAKLCVYHLVSGAGRSSALHLYIGAPAALNTQRGRVCVYLLLPHALSFAKKNKMLRANKGLARLGTRQGK